MSSKSHTAAIILAAGQGTRMKSSLPKVLHRVAGRPMLWYAATLARRVVSQTIAVVVGHGSAQVQAFLEQEKTTLEPFAVVEQDRQLGTGHAVQQAFPVLAQHPSQKVKQYLILNGDTPLLTEDTLTSLLSCHESEGAALTLLSTVLADPSGYGRIVRTRSNQVARVVEDRDASSEEKRIAEINVGTYVVEAAFLEMALGQLRPQNAQGEYYLTDIIEMAVDRGLTVGAWKTPDSLETTGINTRVHLALAEKEMRRRIGHRLMLSGVTLVDPDRVIVDDSVEVASDTILYPGVILEGQTRIGHDSIIQSNVRLQNTLIGNHVVIKDSCVIQDAVVEDSAVIGPFAHVRPGCLIHRKAKIGNFVELKQTEVGEETKINHLSYFGDTTLGRKVNVGAGTITCNYDGFRKARTTVEDHVFIGSDVQLIAPVTIGEGALIAAGTTVTENVPANALAISRVTQTNKADTAAKRRAFLASSLPSTGEGHREGVEGVSSSQNSSASRPPSL